MNEEQLAFWLGQFADCQTAVVANGEIPASELSLRLLKKKKRIICCDGALHKLLSINVIPDIVVGDGDSMDNEELLRYRIPYHADKSEEYNDLQKALKYCTAKGYDNILLMGCGGLREDHFIANLSILVMYSEKLHLTMLTEHGNFDVIKNVDMIPSFPGMQVSIFPSHSQQKFWFTGLKYPVNDHAFKWLWEGSLNEALEDSFVVEASDDEPFVVYRALEMKNDE